MYLNWYNLCLAGGVGLFFWILNGKGARHNLIRYKVGPTQQVQGRKYLKLDGKLNSNVLKVYFIENKTIFCESFSRFFGSGNSFGSGLREKWTWCDVITDFEPEFLVSFLLENLDLNNRTGSFTLFPNKTLLWDIVGSIKTLQNYQRI